MEITTEHSNAMPRATLVEITLPGEPATDKGYLCADDATHYRVRVMPVDQPNPTGSVAVARYLQAFDITVTRLRSDLTVERNVAGQAVIVAQTRWTVDADTFSADHSENTAEATLKRLIEQQVFRAARLSAERSALATVMQSWGQTTGTKVTVAAKL